MRLTKMINPFTQWFDVGQTTLRALSEFGITVHWIILQYSIGVFFTVVTLEILARKMQNKQYLEMSKSLSKVAVLLFAVGAATGTMSEFGLLLFWPNFLELVGKYLFMPFYLELLMFFAEVVFVYLYYYTWKKVGPKFHIFLGVMAVIGLAGSAIFIVGANTMMSYPPGIQATYNPTTGAYTEPTYLLTMPGNGTHKELTSTQLRAIIASDPAQYDAIMSATIRERGIIGIIFKGTGAVAGFLHAITAAILTSLMTILGVYAYRISRVKEQFRDYYKEGLKIMSILATIFFVLQGIIGDAVAKNLATYNPEKFAAMEGTSADIFGVGDIPIIGPLVQSVVKFLAYGKFTGVEFPDYDAIPATYQAPLIIHYMYYLKIGLVSLLFVNVLVFLFYFYYKKADAPSWLLKLNYASPFLIQLISNLGWMSREIGRKPFTVYGIMTVDEAARTGPLSPLVFWGVILYISVIALGLLFLAVRLNGLSKEEKL